MSDDRESKPPVAVRKINAMMHGLVQLAVWGVGAALMLTDRIPPIEGFAVCGVLTGLGVWQHKKGQPPVSVVVTGFQALGQILRHKGLMVPAVLAASLVAKGCGGVQQAAEDVTSHPVFRGTLGGLLGACSGTRGEHDAWDKVCDTANGLDSVTGLLQTGAGPASLPDEVASRECVAYEDGRLRCE